MTLDREGLILHLASVLIELANSYSLIAECRSDEAMKSPNMDVSKAERCAIEGVRDALIEEKWFILKLLDLR